MSADIVPLFADKSTGPHLEGPCICIHCKHEWRAVTPVGQYDSLECPSCGTYHGVLLGMLGPHDGIVFTCNCGNQLYILTMTGAPMCALCGIRAQSWVDG